MRTWSWSHRDLIAVIAAILFPLAVSAVLVPFRASFPNTDAALVLVVVIVAVAANGQRGAGILAAVSAAAWFDFFLTVPYETFNVSHRADIETTVLLLIVGASVSELAVRGRRKHRAVVTDTAQRAALAATSELVASGAASELVIEYVRARLVELLSLRDCRFERSGTGRLPWLVADGRLRLDDGYWDLDEYGMPGIGVDLPASYRGASYGRFELMAVPGSLPSLAARQVAVMLANQVGAELASGSRSTGARSPG
ncbi:MAG TPA: DUF4118 domain-containing protein [Jatrophihabitantaceae bacterium]|jgi:hypothetical protein|nr:DUF4118 domain-containing protein [Jatrophihabitantaceae bacterium]